MLVKILSLGVVMAVLPVLVFAETNQKTQAKPLSSKSLKADVYVLIDDGDLAGNEATRARPYWMVPGQVTNVAALLYGRTPLECGLVSDTDWRRKPVLMVSLADQFKESGYHALFLGDWGMGLQAPYDPAGRGFDSFWLGVDEGERHLDEVESAGSQSIDSVIQSLPKDRPCFCIIRQGRSSKAGKAMVDALLAARSGHVGVLCKVTRKGFEFSVLGGGEMKLPKLSARAVWELAPELLSIAVGTGKVEKKAHLFYHQGAWPLTDSPEKYRHKGSVVLGEHFALVDGLNLFAVNEGMSIDKDRALDLGEHADAHQQLLRAHSQWWQVARRAINDPRPFDVGGGGNHAVTRLTAMDWRPSRIVHADGSALASEPMVALAKLTAIIRGLHEHESYKQSFPAYSGSWSLNIKRPGRYKLTARLLPASVLSEKDRGLAKLLGGRAHFKLGQNEVQLRIQQGAEAVSVLIDADAGITDLECWFTGQLSLERELGAFFVEVERMGDKKFNIEAKEASGSLPSGKAPTEESENASQENP
ncbi:hypothetical protein HW115_02660 [Verrucomicrobiaceae bacterium N1E253]|uniref:Uncharacterized protein n=1 Tax=Oceaniferula marina TaxID=2748318 RepID=A0A851GAR4_9BACT|nr:hypothetical protein [Oceaniferula marina]NWK54496.1 hypothetical protein [Oceaniferula marina]